jgi:hypothetical protein
MLNSRDIYQLLTDTDDGRLCRDLPEDACRESPRAFLLLLVSFFLTKLGDALASPKTTLAWLVSAVGAPAWVLGYLVPIRESGSMVPQLLIGGWVRGLPLRKWVWVAGSLVQGVCIAGLAWVALSLSGHAAGWAMLGLVALFSLARSFSSIASKDVIGKTVPKGRRGQLSGWAGSAAGLLSVGVGVTLALAPQDQWDGAILAVLLLAAASLWWLASLLFAAVPESRGETGGGRSVFDSLASVSLLWTDRDFFRFVAARALLMCSALSAPFYVALAQSASGSGLGTLGGFVIAAGVADLASGPFWGRFADRSSRAVMTWAALVTAAAGLATFAVATFAPSLVNTAWFIPASYFVLSVAHQGVRVGRKTYVVNLGEGNRRTDYVAISNSVIGVLLLVVGSVGALTPWLGNAGVIALLAGMGLVGAIMTRALKDV